MENEKLYSNEQLLKAQQAILSNQKDAVMDPNYILEYLSQYKPLPDTRIEKVLDEILNSVQSTDILDPFDAGIVSTVAIIKKELGFPIQKVKVI